MAGDGKSALKISNPKYPTVPFLLYGFDYPQRVLFQKIAGLRLHVARVFAKVLRRIV